MINELDQRCIYVIVGRTTDTGVNKGSIYVRIGIVEMTNAGLEFGLRCQRAIPVSE